MKDVTAKGCQQLEAGSRVITIEEKNFLIAEYSALRAEMLKRIEIQHQLISYALIASAAFLGLIGVKGFTTVLLAYPILAMFLAAAWFQCYKRICKLGEYIRERIEIRLLANDLGWEHAFASRKTGKIDSFFLFSPRGIIVGTQFIAVFIALFKTSFPLEDIVLLLIDGFVIILTILLLQRKELGENSHVISRSDSSLQRPSAASNAGDKINSPDIAARR